MLSETQTEEKAAEFLLSNKFKVAVAGFIAGAGMVVAWRVYWKYFRVPRGCKAKKYQAILKSDTLMAKHLVPDLQIKLKDKRTTKGYTLNDLTELGGSQTETWNYKKPGIVIGDEECYEVFRALIDPVIMDLHKVEDIRQMPYHFLESDWMKVKGGKLVDKKILCCVLSSSRNIRGHSFSRALDSEERNELASMLVRVLTKLPVPLLGDYARLCNLAQWQQDRLGIPDDYGLESPSGPLPPILSRDWPDDRFVWWTDDRKYRAYINFLDHIKFVISRPKGDLQQALKDYMNILSQVERILKEKENKEFAWEPKYGYLTSYLADIGTGLHVEVKMKFQVLHKSEVFERLLTAASIICKPCDGDASTDTFTITNKHVIGTTEVEIIQHVVDALTLLLEVDKRLSRGQQIQDILP